MKQILFGVIFVLAISLRLIAISERPLSSDELWTMTVVKSNVVDIIKGSFADFRPPLYYLTALLWTKIFGSTISALRLFSLSTSLISLIFIYKTARLISTRTPALITLLLASISAGLIYDSADARMTSLALCFTAIMLWSFVSYMKKNSLKYLIYLSLSATGAVYTYYYPLFILPFVLLTILRYSKSPSVTIMSIVNCIILLPLFSGLIWSTKFIGTYHSYLINSPLKSAAIFVVPFIPSELIIFNLVKHTVDQTLIYFFVLLLAIFTGAIIFRIFSIIKRFDRLLLTVFSIAPLIFITLLSVFWRSIISVHTIILFTLPFYILIPRLLVKFKHTLITFIIFCGILTGFYLSQFERHSERIKPDLLFLEAVSLNPHPADLVLVNNIYGLLWLKYLNLNLQVSAFIPSTFNPVIEHSLGYTIIDADDVSANKITLVEMPYLDFKTEALAFKFRLNERYNLISQKNYTNALVYTYQKK